MDRQVNPGFYDSMRLPGHPFRYVVAHADNKHMDAPRGPVEFEESDELERLRRRAYGPDADIAEDAAAQARLSELEAAQHRQLTPVVDAAARGPAAVSERVQVAEPVEGPRPASTSVPKPVDGEFAEHGPAGGSVTGQHPTDGPIADSHLIDGPPAAPWWRRWFVILGVAIAALVLIAAGAWMSQLLADESTPIPTETATEEIPPFRAAQGGGSYVPAPDYVLALKSDGAAADQPHDPGGKLNALGISPGELKRYEDFYGPEAYSLTVWSGESRYGMSCLLLSAAGQPISDGGRAAEGCSLKGLDTIADIMGTDSLTRLVLKGDHINVYVYERGADPNAPQG